MTVEQHLVMQVARLARSRVRPKQMAESLAVSLSQVYAALLEARHQDPTVPTFTTSGMSLAGPAVPFIPLIPVMLSRGCAKKLSEAAKVRGLSIVALARRIIELVAEDDLVDAVLDDADERAGR